MHACVITQLCLFIAHVLSVSYSNIIDDLQELSELKVWHADTINELEKTRKLLQMQHVISKDYKAEVCSKYL